MGNNNSILNIIVYSLIIILVTVIFGYAGYNIYFFSGTHEIVADICHDPWGFCEVKQVKNIPLYPSVIISSIIGLAIGVSMVKYLNRKKPDTLV